MAAPGRTFVDIRLSHLLRDCAVGAIVRHDKALMVVQDTRDWDGPNSDPYDREIRYVELVRRSLNLGATKLCRPPKKTTKGELVHGWVPARRFPEWMRCSRCGLLHNRPWRRAGGEGSSEAAGDGAGVDGGAEAGAGAEAGERKGKRNDLFHCRGPGRTAARRRAGGSAEAGECGGVLEQVPWVLIHDRGYLADVPWHAIAHDRARSPAQRACKPDWTAPYLKVENREGRWRVRCSRRGCRAQGRILDRFPFGANAWQQPWFPSPPPEPPEEPGSVVGVNDVRVHYAETRTALVIPPESRVRRGSVVDRLYSSSDDVKWIRAARSEFARRSRLRSLAATHRCGPEKIEAALREIDRGYPYFKEGLPRGSLPQLEYRALTDPIPKLQPGEDFVTEHRTEEWLGLRGALGRRDRGDALRVAAAVDRLVAVHRVKQIMVFDGFRRGGGEAPTPPDIVGESGWLPALELWGEGLFFTFDENQVRRWEAQAPLRERAAAFLERAVVARLPEDVEEALSPRFLLCHTLAHLIIRRLESAAGYPAASLKERIYCDVGRGEGKPLAGILIYVAVADEHGSLGGLMDMAQPKRFLRLLAGAVEDATWCSFDPVCAEQEGHGPDLLNRAACHACALVPEPSCICGNRLLDRAFVVGDGKDIAPLGAFGG